MSFHEVRFPAALSFGSSGGPERRTEIVALNNGHEERNTAWAHPRRRYDAGIGLRSLDDIAQVVAFFEARRGRLFGFRWKDWADFKSCPPSQAPAHEDQVIAVGDGSTRSFPLVKTYGTGADGYLRPITKPVAGSVRVAVAGDRLVGGVNYTVDSTTGLVSFQHPPGQGMDITAGYEFDVPVRFDTDHIAASVAGFEAGEVPSVPVVEVRL